MNYVRHILKYKAHIFNPLQTRMKTGLLRADKHGQAAVLRRCGDAVNRFPDAMNRLSDAMNRVSAMYSPGGYELRLFGFVFPGYAGQEVRHVVAVAY